MVGTLTLTPEQMAAAQAAVARGAAIRAGISVPGPAELSRLSVPAPASAEVLPAEDDAVHAVQVDAVDVPPNASVEGAAMSMSPADSASESVSESIDIPSASMDAGGESCPSATGMESAGARPEEGAGEPESPADAENVPSPIRFLRAYYAPDGSGAHLPMPPAPETAPIHVFPSPVQALLGRLADCIGAHVNLAVGALLGLVASAAGGKVGIKIDVNEAITANAFFALLGEKSDGKSSIMRKVFKHFKKMNQDFREKYMAEKEAYDECMQTWENGDRAQGQKKPKPPVKGTILVQDPTRAAIVRRFAAVSSQAVIVDELAALFKGLDAYDKGRGATKEIFLSAYDGGDLEAERADDERCVAASHAWLTIVGGLQTVRLPRMFTQEDLESGWLSRMSFARGVQIGLHPWSTVKITDQDWAMLRRITEVLVALRPLESGEPRAVRVPDSLIDSIWIPWFNQRDRDFAVEAPHIHFLMAKHAVVTQKCILWLHLLNVAVSDGDVSGDVTEAEMRNGILLGDWLSTEGLVIWKLLESGRRPDAVTPPLDTKIARVLLAERTAIMEATDGEGFVANEYIMKLLKKHGVRDLSSQSMGRILSRLRVPEPRARKANARGRIYNDAVFHSLGLQTK